MPNVKFTDLPVASTPLTGAEVTALIQSAVSKQATVDDLFDFVSDGLLPIDLASEVSGNLAISHLNDGTGASSATFWRGDGIWAAPPGGGGSPGGNDLSVQYNDSGAFGGSDAFTWDLASLLLTLNNADVDTNGPTILLQGGIPVLELRALSNPVTPDKGRFQFLADNDSGDVILQGLGINDAGDQFYHWLSVVQGAAGEDFAIDSLEISSRRAFSIASVTSGAAVIGVYGSHSTGILELRAPESISFSHGESGTSFDFVLGTDGDWLINSAPGSAGQVITSNGAGNPPTWEDAGGGGGGLVLLAESGTELVSTSINGGAVVASFVANDFLIGDVYRLCVVYLFTAIGGVSLGVDVTVDGALVAARSTNEWVGGVNHTLKVEVEIYINQNGANYEAPCCIELASQLDTTGGGLTANNYNSANVANNTSAPLAALPGAHTIQIEMAQNSPGAAVRAIYGYLTRMRT